jgi:hypothetical protein
VPSQFEKRKNKLPSELVKQVEEKIVELRSAPELTYPETALDIYLSNDGKTYEVAEIAYNPETKDAKIINTFSISRLVALTAMNQKVALNTLKRKLIKK